jgi:hypothetical protein
MKNIEESQYIEDNIKKIMKNQAVIDKIIGILKKQLQSSDKHLLFSLYLGKNIQKNDIDIIKVLKNYLSDLLSVYLDKFIIKVEKDNILYSLLTLDDLNNNENNEINKINVEEQEEEINTSSVPLENEEEINTSSIPKKNKEQDNNNENENNNENNNINNNENNNEIIQDE